MDLLRKSESTLKDLADSFLHRIAAREQILPYTDVVRWAIEEIPILDRTFSTRDGRIFGSFKPDDLRQMYHFPEPEKIYNKAFLEKFASENEIESEPIKDWRQNPNKHKHESSGKYSVDSLASPYCYAGIMMCRLWGLHDSANFTIEMVPLMEAAVNSIIMDWVTILSDKLAVAVRDFRSKTVVTERKIPPFYYSAYILDTLCFNSEFRVLGWRWTAQDPSPIHIYHQELWKPSYKHHQWWSVALFRFETPSIFVPLVPSVPSYAPLVPSVAYLHALSLAVPLFPSSVFLHFLSSAVLLAPSSAFPLAPYYDLLLQQEVPLTVSEQTRLTMSLGSLPVNLEAEFATSVL